MGIITFRHCRHHYSQKAHDTIIIHNRFGRCPVLALPAPDPDLDPDLDPYPDPDTDPDPDTSVAAIAQHSTATADST